MPGDGVRRAAYRDHGKADVGAGRGKPALHQRLDVDRVGRLVNQGIDRAVVGGAVVGARKAVDWGPAVGAVRTTPTGVGTIGITPRGAVARRGTHSATRGPCALGETGQQLVDFDLAIGALATLHGQLERGSVQGSAAWDRAEVEAQQTGDILVGFLGGLERRAGTVVPVFVAIVLSDVRILLSVQLDRHRAQHAHPRYTGRIAAQVPDEWIGAACLHRCGRGKGRASRDHVRDLEVTQQVAAGVAGHDPVFQDIARAGIGAWILVGRDIAYRLGQALHEGEVDVEIGLTR